METRHAVFGFLSNFRAETFTFTGKQKQLRLRLSTMASVSEIKAGRREMAGGGRLGKDTNKITAGQDLRSMGVESAKRQQQKMTNEQAVTLERDFLNVMQKEEDFDNPTSLSDLTNSVVSS